MIDLHTHSNFSDGSDSYIEILKQAEKLQIKRLYEKCVKIGMKFENNIIENYKNSEYYYATEYLHNKLMK